MKLQGKVAVVTGAAAGIGEASSRLFAQHGARVACIDLNAGRVERVCEAIRSEGHLADAFAADVAQSAEVQQTVEEVLARYGRIDILFNNAGIVAEARFTPWTKRAGIRPFPSMCGACSCYRGRSSRSFCGRAAA